jgi:hypothetical protein
MAYGRAPKGTMSETIRQPRDRLTGQPQAEQIAILETDYWLEQAQRYPFEARQTLPLF